MEQSKCKAESVNLPLALSWNHVDINSQLRDHNISHPNNPSLSNPSSISPVAG